MFLLPSHKQYQFDTLEKSGDWFFIPCSFTIEMNRIPRRVSKAKIYRGIKYKVKCTKGEIIPGESGMFVTRID